MHYWLYSYLLIFRNKLNILHYLKPNLVFRISFDKIAKKHTFHNQEYFVIVSYWNNILITFFSGLRFSLSKLCLLCQLIFAQFLLNFLLNSIYHFLIINKSINTYNCKVMIIWRVNLMGKWLIECYNTFSILFLPLLVGNWDLFKVIIKFFATELSINFYLIILYNN